MSERGDRSGAGTVIVRTLALIGVAALAGAAHSLTREYPIRLGRAASAPAGPMSSGTGGGPTEPNAGQPAGQDPDQDPGAAAGDGRVYDADRVASLSGESLLDEPVLPGMITLRRAHELFEQGATFLDARHKAEYEAGHVPGAVWMPAEDVFDRADEVMAFDPALPVVIYCEGGPCEASHNTANRLDMLNEQMQLGFGEVHIMGLGFDEWARAGLPATAGSEP